MNTLCAVSIEEYIRPLFEDKEKINARDGGYICYILVCVSSDISSVQLYIHCCVVTDPVKTSTLLSRSSLF